MPQDSRPEIHILTPPVDRVFLIGYRGTGKTTIAPLLAEMLGWTWVDADKSLEARHGRSIRAIFADEGEGGFRDKEAALLDQLCSNAKQVVATGGGVVLRQSNCERLRAAGWVAWLTADAPTIWQRLQSDPATMAQRPDLSVGGLPEIEAMLRIREPLYRSLAHCTIDTMARSPRDIARTILARLAPQS